MGDALSCRVQDTLGTVLLQKGGATLCRVRAEAKLL